MNTQRDAPWKTKNIYIYIYASYIRCTVRVSNVMFSCTHACFSGLGFLRILRRVCKCQCGSAGYQAEWCQPGY